MKTSPTNLSKLALAGLALSSVAASAQVLVYAETFDAAAPAIVTNANNIQLGGSTKPSTAKYIELGQWGFHANGSIVNVAGTSGNALQPQLDTKTNGRVAGIYLEPALFATTGAGTYTLTFDVIPSSSSGAGRVYIGAGSGYDLSRNTTGMLNLNLATNGFGINKATGALIWPALTAAGGATAAHLLTTSTEWIDSNDNPTGQFLDAPGAPIDVETAATLSFNFEYDGTSTVVLAFGGYDTDFKVDNITIATAVQGAPSWAGYSIQSDHVDTGAFMGWLNVADTPWVWSLSLSKYIYMPEEYVSAAGAWTYVPR